MSADRSSSGVEVDLRQAQKLEAIGRLSAGLAHEINTPLQFVSDNVTFVRDGCRTLLELVDRLAQELRTAATQGTTPSEAVLDRALEEADFGWLQANSLQALDDISTGLRRVGSIVQAMRHFAHADRRDCVLADLNEAVRSTVVIARHEYSAVADIELSLDEIPLVPCHVGEVNQVLLNMLVNAAHAIAERQRSAPGRGRIVVSSKRQGECVVLAVQDSGAGIPAEIRDRVYEPFFTTKDVGQGTGQGLAICRSVVQRHGGRLWFETEIGVGTTFYVELPLEGAAAAA